MMAGSKATFAAGCFWCIESAFKRLKGVASATPGYCGGHLPNPTYEQVCTGTTGHAEVVQIEFDPAVISFDVLLDVFFTLHDPTSLNRQGGDVGTQYRSAVFCHNEEQKRLVEAKIKQLTGGGYFAKPIVTTIENYSEFYAAEAYHHNYFERNPNQPYCAAVVAPKLKKFSVNWTQLLRS